MEVVGQTLDVFPIEDLKVVSDLVYYDGPILSHGIDKKGKNYMIHWIDQDENFNRWLIFKVSEKSLFCFLKKREKLGDILNKNNLVFIVDVDNDYRRTFIADVDELPESYTPDENYYYEMSIPESYEYLLEKFGEKIRSVPDIFVLIKKRYEEKNLLSFVNSVVNNGTILQF